MSSQRCSIYNRSKPFPIEESLCKNFGSIVSASCFPLCVDQHLRFSIDFDVFLPRNQIRLVNATIRSDRSDMTEDSQYFSWEEMIRTQCLYPPNFAFLSISALLYFAPILSTSLPTHIVHGRSFPIDPVRSSFIYSTSAFLFRFGASSYVSIGL